MHRRSETCQPLGERRVHVAAFLEDVVQRRGNGGHVAVSSPREFRRHAIIPRLVAASQLRADKQARRPGQSSRRPQRVDEFLDCHALAEIRIDKSGPDYSILSDDEGSGDGQRPSVVALIFRQRPSK